MLEIVPGRGNFLVLVEGVPDVAAWGDGFVLGFLCVFELEFYVLEFFCFCVLRSVGEDVVDVGV